jgi:hypothetical protein
MKAAPNRHKISQLRGIGVIHAKFIAGFVRSANPGCSSVRGAALQCGPGKPHWTLTFALLASRKAPGSRRNHRGIFRQNQPREDRGGCYRFRRGGPGTASRRRSRAFSESRATSASRRPLPCNLWRKRFLARDCSGGSEPVFRDCSQAAAPNCGCQKPAHQFRAGNDENWILASGSTAAQRPLKSPQEDCWLAATTGNTVKPYTANAGCLIQQQHDPSCRPWR